MRTILPLAVAAIVFAAGAPFTAADTTADKGIRLYALAEAGSEYCPEIEMTFLVRPVIARAFGFDAGAAIRDGRLDAERTRWFGVFRSGPGRAIVCAQLMDSFGPGNSPQLFEWR